MNSFLVLYNSRKQIILLFLSILEFIFWVFSSYFNVYKYALIGAIYELLALPMLLGIIVLGILNILELISKKPFAKKILSVISIALLIIIFILLN